MKNVFIILSLIFLFSCKEGNKSVDNNINSEKLFKDFNGVWVRKDYINSLEKSLSPANSYEFLEGISSILINAKDSRNNKLDIGISYNNHEGSNTSLSVKGNNYFIELTDEMGKSSSKVSLKNNELYFESKSKKYTFLKVLNSFNFGDDAGIGIQYITNKILFGGITFDCVDIGKNISFDNDGIVNNFYNYKLYTVETDFETAPEPMDFLLLKNSKKEMGYYYMFNKDSLKLFEYDIEKEGFELRYILLSDSN